MKVVLAFLIATAVVARADPTWKVLNDSLATFLVGVAFVTDNEGYTVGDANGVGPLILKSNDGGHDWADCQAKFGADILLLDVDAVDQTVVVSSVFGELYSDDNGRTFNPSYGGGQSQSVRYLGKDGDGGHKFGCTGTYHFETYEGVAVSNNGGKTFTAYNASLSTFARYGAFPTDDVWYVAAGQFPNPNRKNEPLRRTFQQDAKGRFPPRHMKREGVPADGYVAQIAKTTDAGKTWTSIFLENGTFYFNGIDCAPGDPTHCCALGESFGIPAGGARIHCTTDGGATWQRTFWMPETEKMEYSLMELRYVDATHIYAVGSELTRLAPSAWFLESTDGGQTWSHTVKPVFGYAAFSVTMLSNSLGFAAVTNLITQTAGVAKFSD